jgi:hypothetical protein
MLVCADEFLATEAMIDFCQWEPLAVVDSSTGEEKPKQTGLQTTYSLANAEGTD